ncbi:MAG: ABC transporter substrate-binding protein [Sphaerochaeta sp.]|nr:MAG: ABC transporter substrate-binding protein [Sphaerochaeta sp.]HOR80266.1 ABC transporter substrate-binding protein [Sphaerochaeta sp.]
MKHRLSVLVIILLSSALMLFARPVKESPAGESSSFAVERITVGTTAKIEKAERGEYAFDMLASAVTELPLVYQDTSGSYHPLLVDFATEDGVSWTFTLKDGLKWSDGVAVTAEDILFTFQHEDASGSAYLTDQTDSKGKVTKAKYVSCTVSADNRSITLVLPSANVRMLGDMTSFRILPKHIFENNASPTVADKRIGCGPYTFDSFSAESGTIVFKANADYPETPRVGEIVYRIFGNEDTMYLALQNGDIDIVWNYSMGVPATYQDFLASSPAVSLVAVPATNAPAVLAFNNAKGPFADENLRKAVSYALDYDLFKAYFGSEYASVPNRGFVPPTTVGYKDTEKLGHDIGKADGFMAAAGYRKNALGVYVDSDGEPMSFALTVNSSKQTHLGYAELIKTQLEAFGMQVAIDGLDGASYNAKTSNRFSNNNITTEAAIYGYTSAGMGMMNGLGSIYVDGTHAVQGGCQVFDPEFQAVIARLASSRNLEEYYVAAGALQDFYAAHTPLIALYWDNLIYAYSSGLGNLTVDAVFGLNNVNNWMTISSR